MSFFTVEPAPARLNRSELAVPGSQPQLFEKAAKSAADVIFLDLEDAVAPDDKEKARKNVIAAVGDIDWGRRNSLGPDQRPQHPLHSLGDGVGVGLPGGAGGGERRLEIGQLGGGLGAPVGSVGEVAGEVVALLLELGSPRRRPSRGGSTSARIAGPAPGRGAGSGGRGRGVG